MSMMAGLVVAAVMLGTIVLLIGIVRYFRELKESESTGQPRAETMMKLFGLEFKSEHPSLLLVGLGGGIAIAALMASQFLLPNTGKTKLADAPTDTASSTPAPTPSVSPSPPPPVKQPMTLAQYRARLDRVLPIEKRGGWSVSLLSCLVLKPDRDAMARSLTAMGFTSIGTHARVQDERTLALSPSDAILYYTPLGRDVATAVAGTLNIEFGTHFVPVLGEGNGLRPDQRETALVIHRIGNECLSKTMPE